MVTTETSFEWNLFLRTNSFFTGNHFSIKASFYTSIGIPRLSSDCLTTVLLCSPSVPSVCPSFRPSVRSAFHVRSVAPTVLVESISYLYTSYQATSEGVSPVKFLTKFGFLVVFFKLYNFDFVLLWLGIWCESVVWVIMGRGWGGVWVWVWGLGARGVVGGSEVVVLGVVVGCGWGGGRGVGVWVAGWGCRCISLVVLFFNYYNYKD